MRWSASSPASASRVTKSLSVLGFSVVDVVMETVIPFVGSLRSSERIENGREGLTGARVDLQHGALVERGRATVHDRERLSFQR